MAGSCWDYKQSGHVKQTSIFYRQSETFPTNMFTTIRIRLTTAPDPALALIHIREQGWALIQNPEESYYQPHALLYISFLTLFFSSSFLIWVTNLQMSNQDDEARKEEKN